MKAEIRDEWARRLESGDYKQGRSLLHYKDDTGDHYCCLGVLCEMAVEAGVVERWEDVAARTSGTVGEVTGYSYGEVEYKDGYQNTRIADGKPSRRVHSFAVLPEAVMEWAGLPDQKYTGDVTLLDGQLDGEYVTATARNDGSKDTFEQIAALVRGIPANEPTPV